ncbi:MAG: hypothetical protein DWB48_06505, partial [Nitrosomonas sp.]|nr:hypothetical protein [Nitrosomonas sp.]
GVFWPLALPAVTKLIITLLLAGSLYYYLRRYVWLISPRSIVALHLTGRNGCRMKTRADEYVDTVIDTSTFVALYMTVLCLRKERTKHYYYTVVILSDSIDTDSFRRLRVWLRWKWQDSSSDGRKRG